MGRNKTAGSDLPPFVRRKRWPNGRVLYYFNAGPTHRDMPLGEVFDIARYPALMEHRARVMGHEARKASPQETPLKIFKRLSRAARTRARNRKLAFDLTPEFLFDLYTKSNGRCTMTGIPFDLRTEKTTRVRPYGISLDRIQMRGGYTRGNVRLICCALNIAINEFGWTVYKDIALRALRTSAIAVKTEVTANAEKMA